MCHWWVEIGELVQEAEALVKRTAIIQGHLWLPKRFQLCSRIVHVNVKAPMVPRVYSLR